MTPMSSSPFGVAESLPTRLKAFRCTRPFVNHALAILESAPATVLSVQVEAAKFTHQNSEPSIEPTSPLGHFINLGDKLPDNFTRDRITSDPTISRNV